MQKMTITGEFSKEVLDALASWDKLIPTLYFLDICVISHIKDFQAGVDLSEHKQQIIAQISRIDLAHNGISYLAALVEKASDQMNLMTTEELITQANLDIFAIQRFFKEARLIEMPRFIHEFIRSLKGEHPELLGSSYHMFLQFANASGIHNTAAPSKRISVAKMLCEKAVELGIPKQHPVVLTTLACVYGSIPAKKVMKLKQNPREFNSSNALGDILFAQRFGKYRQAIEAVSSLEGRFVRSDFVTSDQYLQTFISYFDFQEVLTQDSDDSSTDQFTVAIKANGLFPVLYNENNELVNESELLKLYELLEYSTM